MEKTIIKVYNPVKAGYRRAGMALEKGENIFIFTALDSAKITALQSDHRLSVVIEQMDTAQLEEMQQRLSEDVEDSHTSTLVGPMLLPADLTVEQLKTHLRERGVAFASSAKKEELVALLQTHLAQDKA